MKNASEEKLADYISWFIDEINDSLIFPIGSIVFSEDYQQLIVDKLKNKGVVPVRILPEEHPDRTLERLFAYFEKQKVVALYIKDEIPTKILNQLEEIRDGKMKVQLVGKEDLSVLNPIPSGAKLILLINESNFDKLGLEKFALSTCRI